MPIPSLRLDFTVELNVEIGVAFQSADSVVRELDTTGVSLTAS